MSFPTILRSANNNTVTAAALGATLGTAATAGDLLVYIRGHDKNGGSLTMSDNIGTNGGLNPWTVEVSLTSTSVSLYVAWKVAVGGETTVTGTVATAPVSGDQAWLVELTQTGSGAWAVAAKATNITDEATVTSRSTGTTGAASRDGLALAAVAIDSSQNVSNGMSWSNSYAAEFSQAAYSDGGGAGLWTASLNVSSGATTTTTGTAGSGSVADQMSAAVVVFGRTPTDASVPPVRLAQRRVGALLQL